MELKKLTAPYPHAIITNVIPSDVYSQLKFPQLQKRNNTRAGWDLFKGEKRYARILRLRSELETRQRPPGF